MKLNFKTAALALIVSTALFSACKKDPAPTPTPAPKAGLTWTENGGATITADSAYWQTGSWGSGVRAFKNGTTQWFEINWHDANGTSVGKKAMDANWGGFTYINNGTQYAIVADTALNITALANDKLSGNFDLPVKNGGTTIVLKGTFTELPKK